MQGKLRKNVGFTLIFFAFFFLFEPSYGLIDPLPDFIGYLILCIGLMNLADINDKIKKAQNAFRNGVILSVLRYVSIYFIEKSSVEGEQTVGQLLFVFVFALFELFIMIPGYKALFEGLLTLGIFEGGEAVHYKKREKGKNASEKMYSRTVSFLLFKNIICALPEFTSLQENTGYEFVNILRILAIIVILPICITWLVSMLVYLKRVEKDTPFIEALANKYITKTVESPDFFKNRALSIAHYLVMGAFFLSFDLYLENLNALPDFLFYGAILLIAVFIRKHFRHAGVIVTLSALGTLLSALIYFLEKEFYSLYYIEAVIKHFGAYNHFNMIICTYIAECVVFIALLFFIIKALYGVFTDRICEKHAIGDSYRTEHGRSVKTRAIVFFVAGILNAAATMYRVLSLPHYAESWVFYYSGIITGIVEIAFIATACVMIWYLIGEIKYNFKSYL